jgi:hypothetical protein
MYFPFFMKHAVLDSGMQQKATQKSGTGGNAPSSFGELLLKLRASFEVGVDLDVDLDLCRP